jgi:lipid A oxidase
MRSQILVAAGLVAVGASPALAEFQFSVYGGGNTASGSDVTLKTPLVGGTFDVEWFGDSFNMPPYYGVRATWWLADPHTSGWGAAIDFTHAKVKADLGNPALAVFDRLEFTNGLNTATLNAVYRMPLTSRFTVYAGGGAGAAVPHVEVQTIPDQGRTFEYQMTGPAVQAFVGASMNIAYGFSLFGEYKANYSWHDADLAGGGSLEMDILTHQFALGLSVSFSGL